MSPALALQYLLPHHALSRLVYRATRWTFAPWKNFLIAAVVKRYGVDMGEAAQPDPRAYPSFNAFFTRALKDGARGAPADPRAVACPADGAISQAGAIRAGRILQAKGVDFSVAELIGDDIEAQKYADGRFVTVYLSPRDYHRVHMPLAGTLRETVHIPGRLFSVAPFTVAGVPRLFARNERLVCHFDGEHGAFAVVLVGAMLVSSIETVWSGEETPVPRARGAAAPDAGAVARKDWRDRHIRLERCAELGRFNMGSTVILLLSMPISLDTAVTCGRSVRSGQALGVN